MTGSLNHLRSVGAPVDGGAPGGDPASAWQRRTLDYRLVSPLNRGKFTVIVVGTGLAGAGCAAALGELGYHVECFTFHDAPRRAHSVAANATMVDVDNVLLLRPAEVGPAFEVDPARRPPVGAPERDGALTAVIGSAEADLEAIEAVLGESVLARFVTEHARNDFPALPVREDVDVVVWLATGEHELPAGVERLRLQPTPRSLLP